jgi:chromosomal replication initiator protein
MKETWNKITNALEKSISEEEFNTWIKPLSVEINNKTLAISAPNDFIINYVEENYLNILDAAIQKSDESLAIEFKKLDKSTFVDKLEGGSPLRPNLVGAFTFNSFVEGKSNHMALAAARQVAQNPRGDYNPLFIYGGVGLGKTHLMHAVGNEILKTIQINALFMFIQKNL